jgi:ABC-type glycerol-3-phosphate transport system substrate-binding protein
MKKNRFLIPLVGILMAAVMVVVVACGEEEGTGTTASPTATGGGGAVSGTVSMMAIWSGSEQDKFEAVLDGFRQQYPNVTVNYTSQGDQLPTVLSTAVEGGNPPDLAAIGQPGLMVDFANRDALQPLDFARETIEENYTPDLVELGTVDGTLYGMLFKGANKSTIWYNTTVFSDAGVEAPATWDELLEAADTLKASGTPAYSVGGADGWTLTDLFENIYLRTAGGDMYDQLTAHEIPRTDESVTVALQHMQEIFQDKDNIAGNPLQIEFPTSVSQVWADPPRAAMVMEGDFVRTEIPEGADNYDFFTFPSIDDSPPAVVGGGDIVVMFKDTEASRALVEYLASPEAAEIWVNLGGFSSPNQNVSADAYPDEMAAQVATDLAEAETFRFDLSDLTPAAFGGTAGQGMWRILQDFLENPDDIEQTQQQLEEAAADAYGNQ